MFPTTNNSRFHENWSVWQGIAEVRRRCAAISSQGARSDSVPRYLQVAIRVG
jgi:hypothetical protein